MRAYARLAATLLACVGSTANAGPDRGPIVALAEKAETNCGFAAGSLLIPEKDGQTITWRNGGPPGTMRYGDFMCVMNVLQGSRYVLKLGAQASTSAATTVNPDGSASEDPGVRRKSAKE